MVLLKPDLQTRFQPSDKVRLAQQAGTLLMLFAALYKTVPVALIDQLYGFFTGKRNPLSGKSLSRLPIGILTVATACLLLTPIDHRVTATASVEATAKQVMVAPLDGIIHSVFVKPGDHVQKDQLLAKLDTEKLKLDRQKWQSEYEQTRRDQQLALAAHDRVKLGTNRAQLALIGAEIDQLDQMIDRHEIRAPHASQVLSGDWHEALGASIQSGDIVFELGAGDQHRLVMNIPERHISRIRSGQNVRLRMTGLPDQVIEADVQRILPVASAERGSNRFRVYATITPANESLQPGMEGIAKIRVGRRSLASQWWFSLTERLMVVAWKLGLLV